ncbi:DUF502 domain-containing protein [Cloacibacillus sp. An23]|uniref:DUF502 domain-containing protein n=1 Tax=Cloacibacillus sp. An23 TaxID=1965591 RepID=UPI000B392D81|nr:DUF502 domain-containing protein [Cloacibacillus sp. An23]OUO92866.1 hypothetical protein B5F39_10365 [Cloacibacillus sp. An23]
MRDDAKNSEKKGSAGFWRTLGRDFFLGCVALLPLALLVFVFYYLVYLCEMFGSLIFGFTQSRRSTALIIVFLVCLLIYIGRKLRRRERSLLSLLEQLVITKIPVVGGWYATFRDILQTFTASGGSSYLGTVKIPVGPGYIIAFVSKREERPDGSVGVTVFVPTSPNPTTGFVLFFDERDIEYLDIPPEKAFTMIISLGVKS